MVSTTRRTGRCKGLVERVGFYEIGPPEILVDCERRECLDDSGVKTFRCLMRVIRVQDFLDTSVPLALLTEQWHAGFERRARSSPFARSSLGFHFYATSLP